jgi:hypothetical protein
MLWVMFLLSHAGILGLVIFWSCSVKGSQMDANPEVLDPVQLGDSFENGQAQVEKPSPSSEIQLIIRGKQLDFTERTRSDLGIKCRESGQIEVESPEKPQIFPLMMSEVTVPGVAVEDR